MLDNIIVLSISAFLITIYPPFGLSFSISYIISYLYTRNRYYCRKFMQRGEKIFTHKQLKKIKQIIKIKNEGMK